ncbi:hypothetical protein [Streptomyces sp. NPDC055105]
MLVMNEETFGPLAPVVVVPSFAAGLERASPCSEHRRGRAAAARS